MFDRSQVIKDDMLELTDDPCAFVQGVFLEYVKTLDSSAKGDVTISKKRWPCEGLTQPRNPIQDSNFNFCGIALSGKQLTWCPLPQDYPCVPRGYLCF